MPGFESGATQRAASNASFPAGKGISVATALAGLGEAGRTTAVVLCGQDTAPQYRELLGTLGVAAAITAAPVRTRRHVTISDPSAQRGGVTHVQVQGVEHPGSLFTADGDEDTDGGGGGGGLVAGIRGLVGLGAIVALSGSLPKGAPADLYATLTRQLQAQGGRALLDTSGPALHAGLGASPFAVKANRGEAESVAGHKLPDLPSQLAAARAIRAEHGVGWVILSDGAAGALLVGESGAHHASLSLPPGTAIETDQGCVRPSIASTSSPSLPCR